MKITTFFSSLKPFTITYISVIAFSNFVFMLFSQTIRDIIWSFFKEAGVAVILAIVFVFAFTWLLKARPHKTPKMYFIQIFDVYGKMYEIDGLRTEFKNHDVAWSFMKSYKTSYPLYNFALVSQNNASIRKIIYKYI